MDIALVKERYKGLPARVGGNPLFVGGKMFAMQGGDKQGRPIFTMKLEPSLGDFLRGQYQEIVPGYYMNKTHWNSLYLEGCVPEDVVRDMIEKSYEVTLSSLPKKARQK